MATSAAAVGPPVLRSRPLGALLAAEVLSTGRLELAAMRNAPFVTVRHLARESD